MSIQNLERFEDGRRIRWIADGQVVEERFSNSIVAVPLRSGHGVLIVEPGADTAPDNAVIISADGRFRTQIRNPEGSNGAIGFGDAYYVRDELTLFIFFASFQMGCVVNEKGEVLRTYESR